MENHPFISTTISPLASPEPWSPIPSLPFLSPLSYLLSSFYSSNLQDLRFLLDPRDYRLLAMCWICHPKKIGLRLQNGAKRMVCSIILFFSHGFDFVSAGDISSVTVLGQPLIILNSTKVAVEMLDKKSTIYSDRPVLQMGGELIGWKNTLVLLPYGARFRRFRRLFHSVIGTQSMIKRFYPGSELETRKFLRRILAKPDDLSAHIRKYVQFSFQGCGCP